MGRYAFYLYFHVKYHYDQTSYTMQNILWWNEIKNFKLKNAWKNSEES